MTSLSVCWHQAIRVAATLSRSVLYLRIRLCPYPTIKHNGRLYRATKSSPPTPLIMEWDNGQGLEFPPHCFRRPALCGHGCADGGKQGRQSQLNCIPYALISEAHHTPAKGEKVPFERQASRRATYGPARLIWMASCKKNPTQTCATTRMSNSKASKAGSA
jgi:hypothetical protein